MRNGKSANKSTNNLHFFNIDWKLRDRSSEQVVVQIKNAQLCG
jgi:hypothetical protein